MAELLRRLGCDVESTPGQLLIDVPDQIGDEADYDLVRRLRASIAVLGPLLARCGEARVALPGGDNIGSRGLDLHVAGLQKLGAELDSEHGFLIARAPHGLDRFDGVARLPERRRYREPDDGRRARSRHHRHRQRRARTGDRRPARDAAVDGREGRRRRQFDDRDPRSHGAVADESRHSARPHRRRHVRDGRRHDARRYRDSRLAPEHLEIVLDRLVGCGAAISELDDGFHVEMNGRASAVDVVTLPYPGFPTDFLPMIIGMNAVADGAAMVTENVFEGRFRFIQELVRLGADIRTDGHHAVIRGRERLSGAPVEATDIRAGAGLVLAGLVADGVTTVSELHHIDRGYAEFVEQLQALGADVVREPDPSAMGFDQ